MDAREGRKQIEKGQDRSMEERVNKLQRKKRPGTGILKGREEEHLSK